jgi:Caspase domain
MSKRALLIGSPFAGLTGVGNDIAAMTDLLAKRGFVIDRCCDAEATRDGIIEAWRRLIADAEGGEAAVVYYSGHGGLARVAESEGTGVAAGGVRHPWRYQFIVPMDFHATTDTDFRGIANVELSRLLRDLTARTRNVTLILDCCHAARMARNIDMTPKALPKGWYVGVAAHVERLRAQGLLDGTTYPEGNPNAVRVVAAATTESAYEYTSSTGHRVGVLTEALGMALEEAGERPVSWRSVLQRVRERVLAVVRQQTPDIEGPLARMLFRLDEVDPSGALGVGLQGGRPVLRGGRLAGVEPGDLYTVMPYGAEHIDAATRIATATVTRVHGATAEIGLDFAAGHNAIPDGAMAFPLQKSLRRWSVGVEGDGSLANDLRSRLAGSRFVREADRPEEDPPLARVRLIGGELMLSDHAGLPLANPRPANAAGVNDIVGNLEIFARAQHLLLLQSGVGRHELAETVTIEWGRVEAGAKTPLATSGETLLVGESVYVTLRNESDTTVYASVFDIGVNGKVTLLSRSSPSGIELAKGVAYTVGEDDYDRTLTGLQLSWPNSAPADLPRRETVAIVLTSAPQDLRSVETGAMRSAKSAAASELELLLAQVSSGGMRDIGPAPASGDVRYAVRHIDFMLDPAPLGIATLPPMAEWASTDRGYVFDERPDRSLARGICRAGAGSVAPGAVAVRLIDVVVHRNKALFGGADLRLDCMVVTGAAAGKPYRVETVRFPAIRDNERLPLDRLLVFHGPAAEFLDIAIWLSRDTAGSPGLSQLLDDELNAPAFGAAVMALAGIAGIGPQGAAAVVGIGAAATLVGIGSRLVAAATGKSIGLYRTSLLAAEAFGVGRHPRAGLLCSQDFSFAYEIVAVA